jgi:hypothetical protein
MLNIIGKKKAVTGIGNDFFWCPATSYSHRGRPPTTIGAKELNFRVRDGNGCGLFAIITGLFFLKDKSYYTNSDEFGKGFFKNPGLIRSKLDTRHETKQLFG